MGKQLMTSKEWDALSIAQRKRLIDEQGFDIVKGGVGPWRPESDVEGKAQALGEGHAVQLSDIVVARRKNKGIVLKQKGFHGSIPGFSFPLMEKTKKQVAIPKGAQGRITASSQYAGELHLPGQPPLHVVRKHFEVIRREWRARKAYYGPKKPRLSR